jgi:hypothetical protein
VQVRDLGDGAAGVEWDVRACASFRREPGHWLRLRPGEAVPS